MMRNILRGAAAIVSGVGFSWALNDMASRLVIEAVEGVINPTRLGFASVGFLAAGVLMGWVVWTSIGGIKSKKDKSS